MNLSFDLSWLFAVGLVSIRLGIALYLSPLDAMGRVPARIRLFFALALSVFMVNSTQAAVTAPVSLVDWSKLVLHEMVLGIALALSVHCAFAVFDVAGRLIDFQSGLGAANVLNPATNASEPIFGSLLSMLAVLVFFLVDGHLLMLEGLIFSVKTIPPGAGLAGLEPAAVAYQLGLMFSLGMVLAAPVLACLLLMEAGIAVMARTMPQMNVYFLFLPLKVAAGMALVAMTLKFLSPLFLQVFTSLFQSWNALLTGGQ